MTSMTWMNAPAGSLGMGSVDARPAIGTGMFTGLAVRPAAALGTGVSLDCTAVTFGGATACLRPATRRPVSQDQIPTQTAQNDGTTLGNHSSRRPLS
jgi:hypothetical protein